MFLCLVQHAEAKKEEEDPTRPLSSKGFQSIKDVAAYVSRLPVEVEEIFHSKKLRAKQTAEVLSESLRPSKGFSETVGLAPLDDPEEWAGRLKGKTGSAMLVGHLPHLARLASLLLCGDMDRGIVSFKMGGIVCLKRDEEGAWSVQWMLTPDILNPKS